MTTILPSLPRRLQVEVTASCNLQCRMCIVRYRPRQPRSASLSLTALERLLDGMPQVEELVLQGIGEPLLAPDIYELIAYAGARGIRTEFNTNATLLTPAAGSRLIAAGLDALNISLDGANAETYEFIREGARWSTVQKNVTAFVELVARSDSQRPALSIVTVLMRRNLHQIPDIVRQAAHWRIPAVFVQGLSHDFSDAPTPAFEAIAAFVASQRVTVETSLGVAAVFHEARRVADELGVHLRLPPIEPRKRESGTKAGEPACDWPFTGGYVTQAGKVMPCCMVMGENRIEFGDIHERPYPEIWASDAFQDFRQRLLEGDPHPVCRGCSLYRGSF